MGRAGFAEIGPREAQRGDVVTANTTRPSVGIVGMDGWYGVFLASFGVRRIPLSLCRLAWRVG